MKVYIIIPAFNESAQIYKVIKSIPKKLKGIGSVRVVVVNDGSKDRTAQQAEKAKAIIISHLVNRGVGAATKTGMIFAKKNNADLVITMDADGQHDPKDIQKLASVIKNKNADVVIGSRLKIRQPMPVDRFIINWFANFVTLFLFGVFSTDSQSGLRAFSKTALSKIEIRADRMEFSSEILQEAKKHNLKIKEVPIKPIYTSYSRSKGQKNINALPIVMKFLVKFLR